jgi:hypothetical protein
MPATRYLCELIGIDSHVFSREENIIIEAELYTRIYQEMIEYFKVRYQDYFRLIKFNATMVNEMMEDNFARCLVNDILLTEEYTLQGIAYYTQTPEEVIVEVAMGQNTRPSAILLRRIIELHRMVRSELYREMMKKIANEYSAGG